MSDPSTNPPANSPGAAALRAVLYLGTLALAFPLTWLAQHQPLKPGAAWATGGCVLLSLFNLLVLPRTGVGRRAQLADEERKLAFGLFPLALALGFVIFPPYAVGAAWAVLAGGTAAAELCAGALARPALPWNAKEGWLGLTAFFVAAVPACALLLWWCPVPLFLARDAQGVARVPEWPYVWTLALLTGLSAAVLDSLPKLLPGFLRVPLGASLTVWLAVQFLNFGTSGMPEQRAFQPQWLLHALAVNVALAGLVWGLKFASLPAALTGGALGVVIYFFAQPPGYALLVLFVLAGSFLSRVGLSTKKARGAAEADAGRRRVANVLANLAVPACALLAYPATKGHPAALWAFAGALSAALADTASAEVGALASRRPRLITTGQEVPHGANGGVTWLGYAAAVLACALLAAVAWAGGFWRIIEHGHAWNAAPASLGRGLVLSFTMLAAGLAGTTLDSLLGATLEDRLTGMNKHTVNFFCTLTGAAVAGGLGLLWT